MNVSLFVLTRTCVFVILELWPCGPKESLKLGIKPQRKTTLTWLSGDPQPRSPRLLIRMFTTMYRIIYRTFYHYSWHVLVDVNLFGAFRLLYLSVYSQLYRKTAACCRAEFLFDHPRRAPSAEARWMPMSLLGAQGSKGWGAFCRSGQTLVIGTSFKCFWRWEHYQWI